MITSYEGKLGAGMTLSSICSRCGQPKKVFLGKKTGKEYFLPHEPSDCTPPAENSKPARVAPSGADGQGVCANGFYYVLLRGSAGVGDLRTLTATKRWAHPGHKNELRFPTQQQAFVWLEVARFVGQDVSVRRVLL